MNKATLITNWNQYTQKFGGFIEGAFLPMAVYGFFANGGGLCYVVSVNTLGVSLDPNLAKPAQAALPTTTDAKVDSLVVKALKGGPTGNQVSVEVKHEGGEEGDTFLLIVSDAGVEVEKFEGLSMGSGAKNVETIVNKQSSVIVVEIARKTGKLSERRPATGKYELAGGEMKELTVKSSEFEGDVAKREGLGALEAITDITMVAAPDLMTSYLKGDIDLDGVKAVQGALLDHCERMKYRFAILDAPPKMSPQEIGEWRLDKAGYDSKFGAVYYPWISVPNFTGGNGTTMLMPPSGHMAGVYARVDGQRGVHKAPANEVVMGAVGLEINVTKGEQDVLNPIGVNCIRAFPGRGIRIWGARTLTSDPSWRYINVRRLFNFVEASIEGGTQWVVFEPNDQDLWARVRRDVSAFLRLVWRSGALFGSTPEEAFYVKCDEELNPLEVRDAGQLIIEVGMAPVKPAEFVIFRISQWAGPNAEG
jgi:hypothetical protein